MPTFVCPYNIQNGQDLAVKVQGGFKAYATLEQSDRFEKHIGAG
jgi:hypothetical protein